MPWEYAFGGGPTDFADGQTSSGFSPSTFVYGSSLTFSSAGTVNQLAVYGQELTASTVTVKIALYDASGNLVTNTTLTMDNVEQWHDTATFTAVNVSAATYFIFVSAANNDAGWGYDTAFDGTGDAEAHATFPADPMTWTEGNETGRGFGVRAFFTAGSSSALPLLNAYYHG